MKNPRHSRSSLVILASAVLATLFQVACTQSQTQTAPATPQSKAAVTAAKDVYVVFEGPWVIAPDPKDANSVLLLAPKTKTHRDLYVTASNHSTLSAGVYDLSFPVTSGREPELTIPPSFALRSIPRTYNMRWIASQSVMPYAFPSRMRTCLRISIVAARALLIPPMRLRTWNMPLPLRCITASAA